MATISIEEKAKRYDEAIEELRGLLEGIHEEKCDIMEEDIIKIFPELKESEDERIRKEIKDFFSRIMLGQENFLKEDYDWNTWIAWLEKQGEQKPYGQRQECLDCQFNYAGEGKGYCIMKKPAWSEEDDYFIEILFCLLNNEQDNYPRLSSYAQDLKKTEKWLKSLKDRVLPQLKQEWSKEDENRMDNLCHFLEECVNQYYGLSTLQGTIPWLKSLKDRYTWKPSDAQMASITCAVRKMKESACYDSELVSLYNDLKKLREE